MEVNQVFRPWVPKYLGYAILLLITFVASSSNGVYLGMTTEMYSDLAAYSEPYTMATNAMYIGMGAGFLLIIRLVTRFNQKSMVISGLAVMLLMNAICATTDNPAIAIAASFFLGFSKISVMGHMYLSWLMIWSKSFDASKVYPFFYFIAIAGLNFITWLTALFSYNYSWRYAYVIVIMLITFSIILAVVFFENHELKKKIPLYQLDLPGLLLLTIALMLVNYIAVYGKVEDWLGSHNIQAALFALTITGLFFVKRVSTVKRPILDLKIFNLNNVTVGLLLFLLLGLFTPTTFQTAFATGVLHFELRRNAELYLYLIPGVIAGCILTYRWYIKSWGSHGLFIIGFSAIVLYHIMMYGRFVNDLNISEFLVPSFFRGFALAVLYIAIGLYTTGGLPMPQSLKVVGLVLVTRSFLGTGIAAGLYSYGLYASANKHLSTLAAQIDASDFGPFTQGDLAGNYKYILQQANLAAYKEISGTIIIFGLIVIAALIVLSARRILIKPRIAN